MDGRPNRRNKAAVSNFSNVAWTVPVLKVAFYF